MKMSQATYKALSQSEAREDAENEKLSLTETSDEQTSSSKDSLDLVLLEIGSRRKVKRKRRRKAMGMHNFDGTQSYEVSE